MSQQTNQSGDRSPLHDVQKDFDGNCLNGIDKVGVLVVDDDDLVRFFLKDGLEQNGFNVWLAPNGPRAVDLYKRLGGRIDVVLLDVLMPGLDGLGTLQLLRKVDPTVPACFMTGDTGDYEVGELIRCGASQVISKPFKLGLLTEILRKLANGYKADGAIAREAESSVSS